VKIHMTDTVVEALILDLLEWLATADRSYAVVMDAWRTSCPQTASACSPKGRLGLNHEIVGCMPDFIGQNGTQETIRAG